MQLTAYGKGLLHSIRKHAPGDSKMWLGMKLTVILLLAAILQVSAKTYSQNITLHLRNAPLEKVLNEIKKQSGFHIIYGKGEMTRTANVDLNVVNVPLEEVLSQVFNGQPLTYSISEKFIIIAPRPVTPPENIPVSSLPPGDFVGRVRDDNGNSLAGITIMVKGTKMITATDDRGEFTLKGIGPNTVLILTGVNIETSEIAIHGSSMLIKVKAKTSQLDEVQIIGYGTTTRRKSTGSVSSVTSEDIARQPVQNPLAALEGRIAGAVIIQSNGLPGSRVSMLIRGQNSISNGTVPLYIIDGVPFNINDQGVPANNDLNSYGTSGANGSISPFSLINPSDIERIDVLKDADATAIYGTRGSNGVVLITTKKGKAGKTKLDLNVYQGGGKISRFLDLMSPTQYYALRREALVNDGLTPAAANAPDLVTWDTTKTTDWQKKYLGGTAATTDAEATVSGGDMRTKFLFGAGYHRETTVFPGDLSDQRISVRFNSEHSSLDRKFNALISVIYSYDKSNLIGSDLTAVTYNLPPDLPVYNADGSLYWNPNFTNPQSYLAQKYIDGKNNLISNAVLRYTLLPGLELKTNLGFSSITLNQNRQTPATSQNPNISPTNNAIFSTMTQKGYIAEPQLVYNRNISKGKLTALAGGTWQSTLNNTQYINASNYSNPGLLGTLAGASSYSLRYITQTLYRYNSVFGRLTYDWNSKYIFNGNIRRDGSSRFGSGHRFGTFGSVGAAWIFTNEKFIANSLPFLSFGKLRASYGITGNDQVQDYQFLPTLSTASVASAYQGVSVIYPSRIANPGLHWETNKKMEVGLDLGFFKDRALLTVNYYRNRSNNQLGAISLAIQAGFNSYTGNLPALLQNQGFEFELNTKNIVTKDFTWTSSFNLTVPQNKLLAIDPTYFYASSYKLGKSLNQQWKFLYKGVDPATGNPLYANQTKDTLTFVPNYTTDRSVIGDTDPRFYGGLNNTFTYKSLELSFFFQFTRRYGNIYPSSAPGILANGNQNVYWLDRWRHAGDNTTHPRATTSYSVYSYYSSSTANWGDNSFIRLKNVSFAYNLPSKFIQRLHMSNLRLYAQGQNLFTWTKNKYSLDPETSTVINQAPMVMPPLRTITFGLNCSF
ncbi:MAG TPA: SusC/RagA family TonB-linked outer membrane protein [Puia sp.]|nr:SusC/RagA family TonB-linked outer membrane protein [Puia sp.]